MRNSILFLMVFIASYSFSQSINDYKAVIIPMKYDFQKSENQYRLQTRTKINLETAGMKGFYVIESIPAEFSDRCSLLYLEVVSENTFLATKLSVIFKDCGGKIIYQSPIGKSREKDFDTAYAEALNEAFKHVTKLEYVYNGGNANTSTITTANSPSNVVAIPATVAAVAAPVVNAVVSISNTTSENNLNVLYAQPTSYGYQLIDSEPKVIMKLYKTSDPSSFIAKKETIQGTLITKNNQWFFEYYQNDQLVSELVNVKF